MSESFLKTTIENRQKTAAWLKTKGDVIENSPEYLENLGNILKVRGIIFLLHHFKYPDGVESAGNIGGIDGISNNEIYMPVVMYLLWLAKTVNDKYHLELKLSGIVTPSLSSRKGVLGLLYRNKSGFGGREYLSNSLQVLGPEGIDNRHGTEIAYPKATRGKGRVGEMNPEEKEMVEGLLRKVGQKSNPAMIPTGVWVERNGSIVSPEQLGLFDPFGYHFKMGEVILASNLPNPDGKYTGSGQIIHNAIKDLEPELYK